MVLACHLYFFLQLRDTTRILLWILCRKNGSHFVQNVTHFLFEVKINFKSMAKHISIVRRFVWKIFLLKNSVKKHKFMNLSDFTEFFFSNQKILLRDHVYNVHSLRYVCCFISVSGRNHKLNIRRCYFFSSLVLKL